MSNYFQTSIARRKEQVEELKAAKARLQKEFEEISAELSMYVAPIECQIPVVTDVLLTIERNYKPKEVINLHIQRLKEYNELRDTGLRLAQLVADEKACKIKEVFEEMGYEMTDH